MPYPQRERWATRIGLILAMAGNAIGLGNFLRFPVQAAQNGGGAFMIPYFCALLLLGIPLMWVEWAIGRHGGLHGHGSAPGMFDVLWKNRAIKYVGALGIFLPLAIVIYYNYIESWTLAFSIFSALGSYFGETTREAMRSFLGSFQGLKVDNPYFSGLTVAYLFFLITLGINLFVLWHGVARGIEMLAKIAMPTLFVFAIALVVRVFTLGTPDAAYPDRNVINGLAFIWDPDFSKLSSGAVWLAAAGQIFFTLSLGSGTIHTYASYLRDKDDIALTGLTTSATNEFAEVILGGSIAIPVAVAFFGAAETTAIAKGGAFDLGFNSMPIIFQKIPLGPLFGTLWFLLLFFAGITSSVALTQPAIAFLQEELGISRHRAVAYVGAVLFVCAQPCIFWLGHGFLDEMDFWVGTFGLVLFAAIEVILFAWIFGMDKAWQEIHRGADIRVPRVFYYVVKYVTPVYLLILLGAWSYQQGIAKLLLRGLDAGEASYLWAARGMMVALLLTIAILIGVAWRRKRLAQTT